jgi:peptidoglycan/LPS O-acetylase OafA/YrhL
VLYHVGAPASGGGFVGVDVFFVISGYLITGLLVREVERDGTIRIREFFARRARRLLPTSVLVAGTTLVLAAVLRAPLEVVELRDDALATVAYVANIHFAVEGTDYLAGDAASPFQHFWSLAVEEQFYLVWPLVILAVVRAARTRRRDPRRALAGTLATILVASLALCILWTARQQPLAFFLPISRAWEFAVGGLLVLVPTWRDVPRGVTTAVALGGAAGLLVSMVTFDAYTPFPGSAAILPVASTAALVWAGGRSPFTDRLLSLRPAQAIGRHSYALYLWHWPLLVLLDATPEGTRPWWQRATVVALAALLSVVSHRLVEQPVRHHRWLAGAPARNLAMALSLTGIGLVGAVALTRAPALDAGTDVPRLEVVEPRRDLASPPTTVPRGLRPDLLRSRDALPAIYDDGCHLDLLQTVADDACVYGDRTADRTVVLYGDSHAAHWFPALERIASEHGWRLEVRTKSACVVFGATPINDELGRRYDECAAWREASEAHLRETAPEVVVVGNRAAWRPGDPRLEAWQGALTEGVPRLRETTDALVILGQSPSLPVDIPLCLSGNLEDVSVCATPRGTAVDPGSEAEMRTRVVAAEARYVPTVDLLCAAECPPVVGDLLVYRDVQHLTPAFARAISGAFGARLPELTGRTSDAAPPDS